MKLGRVHEIRSQVRRANTVFILNAWPTEFEAIFVYLRVGLCQEGRLILEGLLK